MSVIMYYLFIIIFQKCNNFSPAMRFYIYIYMYAFSRRFYPKRLTVHSDYTCVLSVYKVQYCQYTFVQRKHDHKRFHSNKHKQSVQLV